MENRIAIFSKRVRDCMREVPLAVPMGMSLADIARRMEAEQASSATVLDAEGRPAGRAFVADPPALRYQVLPFA